MESLKKYIELKKVVNIIESELTRIARKEFEKKFSSNSNAWYTGFNLIDENTLEISYEYGGGDQLVNDSFKVKI